MKRLLCFLLLTISANALPAQMPGLELLSNKDKIELPFHFYYNLPIIEVYLNGVLPVRLIFDTGAENTVLFDKFYTDILNVPYDQNIKIYGSDLSKEITAVIARKVKLSFGKDSECDADMVVLNENVYQIEQQIGYQVDGVLGANIFCGLILDINYARQLITITRPEQGFNPGKKYTSFDIQVSHCRPYLFAPTTCNGQSTDSLKYLIDSGAGISTMLHNNTHPILDLPDKYVTGQLGSGLGGMLEGYQGRIEELRIGPFRFDNLVSNFQDLDEEAIQYLGTRRNGIIGNVILSRFHVVIDYSKERIHLKPTRKLNKEIRVDRSGLHLLATGPKFSDYVVQYVIPGSPADRAGIEKGDLIYKINYLRTTFYSLGALVYKFQKSEGKKMRVVLIREGKKIKTEFRLENII